MRRSLPAVWFGNVVTLCEKPGVLPSTKLAQAVEHARHTKKTGPDGPAPMMDTN